MGLLSLLKRISSQENDICVLVLGFEKSGKTSLVDSFIHLYQKQGIKNAELETTPTIGVEIQEMNFKEYKINFWDVGGSNSDKQYWHNYFNSSNIIMWVIDSTDGDNFEENKKELESILTNNQLAGKSLIIVANKQDDEKAAPFPDFIRDLQINVNEHQWTAIAAANKGEKKRILRDELEKCLEWIIRYFSLKKSHQKK